MADVIVASAAGKKDKNDKEIIQTAWIGPSAWL
jgi:hypothetical protein